MRLFFDTEFQEIGASAIELISIGVVAENGAELYLQSHEWNPKQTNDWIKKNVVSNLLPCPAQRFQPGATGLPHPRCSADCVWDSRDEIARKLTRFVDYVCANPGAGFVATRPAEPEFWAYYADYDWVILCQTYGGMLTLPSGWPMYCRDLKQYVDWLGNPKLPEQTQGEHNSLWDARWTLQAWRWANVYARQNSMPYYGKEN